jgi:hypothetical protein
VILAAGAAAPGAAHAAPEAVATPTVAGPPALVAWSSGRRVFVAGPGGVGRRVVARLRKATDLDTLELSTDGRRLALVTSAYADTPTGRIRPAVRIADLVAGGPLRTLARESSHGAIQWSPDGLRALLVGQTIRVCDVAAQTPCRSVARRVDPAFDATWAPDGVGFAYVGSGPGRARQGKARDRSNLVLNDGAGHERILEREVTSRRGGTQPMNPVWTARGLAWTTVKAISRGNGRNVSFTRSSTRLLGPDGRVRTIAATSRPLRSFLPFALASDSPSGDLIGIRTTLRKGAGLALDGELLRLTPSGATPRWGLTLPGDIGDEGGVRDVYLGMLADGRAAVARLAVEPAPALPGERRAASRRIAEGDGTTTVHLVGPGGPLGPAVAVGDGAASVAVPFPATSDLLD